MTPEELKTLPLRLTTPVLADAIFEVRFRSKAGIADLLPGTLAAGLRNRGTPVVSRLAASELPLQIRMTQPDLVFAPLVQLRWPEFMINVGDRSVAILCTLPYVGWARFKQNIVGVLKLVEGMGLVEAVDQFGFKYIDFLPDQIFPDGMRRLDLDFQLGHRKLDITTTAVKSGWTEEGCKLGVEIGSTLSMTVNGEVKGKGILVGTDAVKVLSEPVNWTTFAATLDTEVDALHTHAKKTFFQCLTKEALDVLGPVYKEAEDA